MQTHITPRSLITGSVALTEWSGNNTALQFQLFKSATKYPVYCSGRPSWVKATVLEESKQNNTSHWSWTRLLEIFLSQDLGNKVASSYFAFVSRANCCFPPSNCPARLNAVPGGKQMFHKPSGHSVPELCFKKKKKIELRKLHVPLS